MPDVGVLNLAIKDNSEQAATGLEKLAGALTRVQAAIDNGLKMSNMSRSLNTFANAVSKNSKVLSGVGTFLNAVTNYTKAFSELNNVKFNKGPIDDLKTAIGDGIKIGQAGTQLINLRTALGGDWDTENAKKAAEALKAIAKGADALQGKRVGAVASKVKALAEAFDSYTVGKNQQFGPSQEQLDELEESRQRLNAWVDEGGFSSGQRMPLYLQFFGGRGTKKSAGQLDMFEDIKSEVKEATQQYYDFRKNTEEYRYQTMNVLDIMDKPLEHLHDIYRTPTTSMEDYKNAVGAALPKVQAMSSEEMLIAGHAREATKAIDKLIKRLNEIPNPSGKGFDGVVNAMTGVASEKLPSGIINESTTMFKALEDTSDGFTKVEKATAGTITVWDEALGHHKQINFEMEKQAEVTEKVADSVGTATNEIREFIDLTKIPASGKNGTFANMSEEISYLMEQLDKAKVGMQQYSDIVAKSEKQIKYGGPMSKDELAFNVRHATEGFYQAAEAEQQYQKALESAFTYAQNYKAKLGSDTAKDTAMDPMTAAVEQLNTAAKDAANDGMEAFNNKMRGTEKDVQSAMSKIELYLEKVALLWGKYYEYRAMPAFDEKGESTGKFEKMNSVLIQIGRVNEQLDKMFQKANDAKEALQFDSLKAGADNMQRGYGNELVENLINNYSEIDLLKMKMDGMKQALADDINQNKVDTQQIADKTIAILNLKNKIEELEKAQSGASDTSKSLRERLEELFHTSGKGRLEKLLSQFARMAKMRSIRYIIRSISAGFREGVQNVYEYSKAIGSSFAPSMDSAATALQQMKNSIGAAAAPAIQALIPLMQTVVNWFITGINYVNQFFALLNSQRTWTRALPATVNAFKNQEKAAKGAAAAMKDLLADWDELNIIQSQTGGGGAGTGTSNAEDYLNMFEEVNRFDNKVKDIVNFIKDNFNTIKTVAIAIGAAMLAWKVAGAVADVLKLINTLQGGVIMSVIGFTLSAAAGRSIGENGLTVENTLTAIGGLAASAIGGYWIGKAALTGLFGASAGMVGAIGGLMVGAAFLISQIHVGAIKSAYGNVEEDFETIKTNVMAYFNPQAEALVEVANARIKDTEDAEKKVGDALSTLNKDYPVAVTVHTKEALDQLKLDVDNLVLEAKNLILQRKKNTRDLVVNSGQFDDAESFIKFSDDQWDKTSKYIEDLGRQMGELISKGITDGAELDGLQEKLNRIVRAATYGQRSGEFTGKVSMLGSNLRENGYTQDTVKQYIDTYETERKNFENLANADALAQKAELKALFATVEERYLNGEATLGELRRAWDAYKNFDTSKEAARLLAQYVGEGDKVFAKDLAEGLTKVVEKTKDDWMAKSTREYIEQSADNVLGLDADGYVESLTNNIYNALEKATGQSKDKLKELFDLGGINPIDLFGDDFAKKIRMSVVNVLKHGNFTNDEKAKIAKALGFGDIFDVDVYANEVAEDVKAQIRKAHEQGMSDDDLGSLLLGLDGKYGKNAVIEALDAVQKEAEKSAVVNTPPKTTAWDEFAKDADIEDIELDDFNVEVDEDILNGYVKKAIELALGDGNVLEEIDRSWLIKQYGEDIVNKVLDEMNVQLEEKGWNHGGLRPAAIIGASGMSTDYGKLGGRATPYTQPQIGATALETESMASDVAKGTAQGNEGQNDLIRELITLATRIANKEWVVNVTPGSGWGEHNARSNAAYDKIRG